MIMLMTPPIIMADPDISIVQCHHFRVFNWLVITFIALLLLLYLKSGEIE